MDAISTNPGLGLPDMAVGMNTILNSIPHPILVLDGVDGITYANPGSEPVSYTHLRAHET